LVYGVMQINLRWSGRPYLRNAPKAASNTAVRSIRITSTSTVMRAYNMDGREPRQVSQLRTVLPHD